MNILKDEFFEPFRIIWLFIAMASIFACDKSEKECPLNTFIIECDESSIDYVFGGYLINKKQYTIEANYCPEDGQKLAEDMSFSFGQSYKRCREIP